MTPRLTHLALLMHSGPYCFTSRAARGGRARRPTQNMRRLAPEVPDGFGVGNVMDALKLAKPLVMGHSMGGMIAAEMAAVAPNEIERMALICPAGLWLDSAPIPDIFAMVPSEFPPLLFHDTEFGVQLMTAGQDMNNLDFLVQFLVMNAKRFGMAGKLLFPIPDRGLSDRIHRIKARTLLIWGEHDKLIPPVYGPAFQQKIAGARLETIKGAGHMVNYEKPEAVIAALKGLN